MKKLTLSLLLLAVCGLSQAADVSANHIIDALKPRATDGQMRTRSLRNLQVEQLPPPSVSLTCLLYTSDAADD